MHGIFNLDLLSVGITAAGIGILGFTIYFNNRKSVTNRTFLAFSLITILWSIANYFQYQVTDPELGLWIVRGIVFLGCWHALLFFRLCYVFPEPKVELGKIYRYALLPIVAITSLITLTPLVFEQVVEVSTTGAVSKIQNGPAIALFGILVLALILSGVGTLIRKALILKGVARGQVALMGIGTLITFLCIIVFNIVFPAFLDNARFLPLSALFFFPFIALTSYAVFRFHLFNIKVAATSGLVFVLGLATFGEVIFSKDTTLLLYRSSVFILVITVGVLLIRGVLREVEQREEIERLAKDLSAANERLKELDKLKSEFVSIASHQLRSPLTAIKGYASLILEGSYGQVPAGALEAIRRIFESSALMALSVDDFLNVSRIEQGRMKYDCTDFDIGKLVKTVGDEMRPIVAKKGLSLTVEAPEGTLVHADLGKIKQVIANLVDNSIKYTPQGSISVSLAHLTNPKRVQVRISDTGVGISTETMPKLFDRFVRAKNASTVNTTGTGLGLYIARQMVEAHKGKIWAESPGEGKGSTFIVELPEK